MKENISISEAFAVLQEAMKQNEDYAWGWQTYIAGTAIDNGVRYDVAAKIAGDFLERCFHIRPEAPPPKGRVITTYRLNQEPEYKFLDKEESSPEVVIIPVIRHPERRIFYAGIDPSKELNDKYNRAMGVLK